MRSFRISSRYSNAIHEPVSSTVVTAVWIFCSQFHETVHIHLVHGIIHPKENFRLTFSSWLYRAPRNYLTYSLHVFFASPRATIFFLIVHTFHCHQRLIPVPNTRTRWWLFSVLCSIIFLRSDIRFCFDKPCDTRVFLTGSAILNEWHF